MADLYQDSSFGVPENPSVKSALIVGFGSIGSFAAMMISFGIASYILSPNTYVVPFLPASACSSEMNALPNLCPR
jgi:hypothetical protein